MYPTGESHRFMQRAALIVFNYSEGVGEFALRNLRCEPVAHLLHVVEGHGRY